MSILPHTPHGDVISDKNLSLSRSYFITVLGWIKVKASVLIVFADRPAQTGASLLHGDHQELRQALSGVTRRGDSYPPYLFSELRLNGVLGSSFWQPLRGATVPLIFLASLEPLFVLLPVGHGSPLEGGGLLL